MKTNKEILEMFIDNFKEFENKYKALTRYVETLQDKKEQLEKENQEQKQVYEARISEYIKKADKHYLENKELKDKVKQKDVVIMQHIQANDNLRLHLQDQFLKVVESVFEAHRTIYDFDMLNELETKKCKCGSRDTSKEHLLQEIKNSLQKSADLSNSQDKKGVE